MQSFTSGNDYFFNLGTGILLSNYELNFLNDFAEISKKTCLELDVHCFNYKSILNSQLPFNYPIMSLIGRFIEPAPNFLIEVQHYGSISAWAGLIISLLLFYIIGIKSNIPINFVCFIWTLATLRFYFDFPQLLINPLINPPPLKFSISILSCCLIASATILLSSDIKKLLKKYLLNSYGPLIFSLSVFTLYLFIPYGHILKSSFFILIFFIFWAAALKNKNELNLIGMLVGFLCCLSASGDIFWLGTVQIPRGNLLILATIIIPTIFIKPNSRLTWSVFFLLFFHTAITAILAVLLWASEALMCLLRRQTSLLFYSISSLLIVSAFFISFHQGFNSFDIHKTINIFIKIVQDDNSNFNHFFLYLTKAVLLFLIAVIIFIFSKNERWNATIRVTFAFAALELFRSLSALLTSNGVNIDDIGLAPIMLASFYATPQIYTITIMTICIELIFKSKDFNAQNSFAFLKEKYLILSIVLLIWGFAWSPYKFNLNDSLSYLGINKYHAKCLSSFSGSDENYFIENSGSVINSPIDFLSTLKYKARIRHNLFNQNNATIEMLAGCEDQKM
ncbi:hypothetical protein [Candidatus Methylopumilus planktonicus]|uniref:hypothetical protein n=1 Tax=Candidatus Methylopumilus planktonicus TaxID=1581557 RepID=UPI003BEF3371